MSKRRARFSALAAAIVGTALGTQAKGGTAYIWAGPDGTAWDTNTAWTPSSSANGPDGSLGDTGEISSGNAKSDVNGGAVADPSVAADYLGVSGSLNNASITIDSGGTLTLGDPGIGNPVTLNGGTIATGDSNHLAGPLSVTAASTITTVYNMQIDGVITGTGSIHFINTSNSGSVNINNTSTGWTGGLSVQGGATNTETVNFGNASANYSPGPINLIGGNGEVEYDGGPNNASPNNVTASSISGNGTIYALFRNNAFAGTTLSPGDPTVAHSVGVLNVGYNFISSSTDNATYVADLNSGSSYDELMYGAFGTFTGATTVNLANMNLQIDLNYAPLSTDKLYIVQQQGTNSISGTFNGIADDSTVDLGIFNGKDYTAELTYEGGAGGNEVELFNFAATPEPASIGIVGFAALGLLSRRREKRRLGRKV